MTTRYDIEKKLATVTSPQELRTQILVLATLLEPFAVAYRNFRDFSTLEQIPDDAPVFVIPHGEDCLYELLDDDDSRLTLEHLRLCMEAIDALSGD